MSFVIVFLIDDPPRLVIDIFSFQWIRGTFIFKSRYCVTRPRSLLVRNVASRYDPWPHFFFLRSRRSTRILSALGERGAGKRKRRELSRGWIAFSKRLGVELDRKSADRFVSRAILSPRAAGEIFAGAGGGNDFPFVHRLRWWMKMILWEWVIRCWSFSSEKIVFEELIEIWLYISYKYNFLLECFYWMYGIMEIEISRFIHKFKSFISRLQILQKILLHFTLRRRHRIFKEYNKFLFIYFFFKFNK